MKTAESVLEGAEEFFKDQWHEYELFRPKSSNSRFNEYAYFRKFDEEEVTIVVYFPVILSNDGSDICTGNLASIVLWRTSEEPIFDLTDTRLSGSWHQVLGNKLYALEWFVDDLAACPVHEVMRIPRLYQTRESGTWFASSYCPRCPNGKGSDKWRNTEWGVGLKTELHQYLKARKTGAPLSKKC